MMNVCKIILIVILALATLSNLITVLGTEGDQQFKEVIKLVIGKPIWWLLFWGAGILTF